MMYILLGLAAAFTAVAAGFAVDCSVELRKHRQLFHTMMQRLREEQAASKVELLHHIQHLAVKAKPPVVDREKRIAELKAARGH